MADSERIAGLVGPTLIAIALSEWVNLPILMSSASPKDLVHLIYLNGTLLFVAGLAIVRAHNRWMAGWPVLVTLTGWCLLVAGLIRMFAPVAAQEAVQNPTPVYAMLVVVLGIGIVLTVKGYGRGDGKGEER